MEKIGWTAQAGHLAGTRRWWLRGQPGQRHLSGYQEPTAKGRQALITHGFNCWCYGSHLRVNEVHASSLTAVSDSRTGWGLQT